MKIAITADSIVDLTPELLSKYDIKIIPLNVILGGEEYYDDGSIKTEDIFDYVKTNNVLPKTAAASEGFYNERFQEILDEGYDALIHFNISSHMSVSHTNAVNASKNFGGKVKVIDSASLSTGAGIQAIYARKLTETETDVEVIVKKVEARKSSVQASFIVEKLDYLHKGGRCSSTAYLFGSAMGVRPQILVKDGKMISGKKYIGRNMPALIKKYCKDTLTEFNTPSKSMCFITYSSATPEMLEAARESIKDVGFEEILETQAGCTITSHCGENTLGILYYNDEI